MTPDVPQKIIETKHEQQQINYIIKLFIQREFLEAIEAATQLLKEYPNSIICFNILGASWSALGQFKKAQNAFAEAIKINPEYLHTYINLGKFLQDHGEIGAAIGAYQKAILINPKYEKSYSNVANVLKGMHFTERTTELNSTLNYILQNKTIIRPREISDAIISILKFEPNLNQYLSKNLSCVDSSCQKICDDLSELPLLTNFMSVCPISDLEIEHFLTQLRALLSKSIYSKQPTKNQLNFQKAMALQCFVNQYLYQPSKPEINTLLKIEKNIERKLLNGEQPGEAEVLCVAAYTPLYQYDWIRALQPTSFLEEVMKQQVTAPTQELKERLRIKSFSRITDSVSKKVKKQYEKYPYPRWINLGLRRKPITIKDLVRETEIRVPHPEIFETNFPSILVAGCGTGQHALETASRFKNSFVLAIDISKSSLAYAQRKTRELGLKNIEYLHGDILEVSNLHKTFDLIECSGVLHHMRDPLSGWASLTNCLKPAGLMNIGLYSKLSRQHILTSKNEINQLNSTLTNSDIRRIRAKLLKSNEKHHIKLREHADFYSLNELKDLLFHEMEHVFTIPQIKNMLSVLELEFCGFDNDRLLNDFSQKYKDHGSRYCLDLWHEHEIKNTNAFVSMYQFWCQKIIKTSETRKP